jgi:hypothetical protein
MQASSSPSSDAGGTPDSTPQRNPDGDPGGNPGGSPRRDPSDWRAPDLVPTRRTPFLAARVAASPGKHQARIAPTRQTGWGVTARFTDFRPPPPLTS